MSKELTTRHFKGYLGYGLECIVKLYHSDYKIKMTAVGDEYITYVNSCSNCEDVCFGHVKPILRPLSDLTKEIEHNGERFVPLNEINKITGISFVIRDNNLALDVHKFAAIVISRGEIIKAIELLHKWHFDIYGLIESGLAIDKNKI